MHFARVLVHPFVPLLAQAILLPSHCCPLDFTSEPGRALSAHLEFPTLTMARRWPDPAEAARVVATLLNEAVSHLLKPSNPRAHFLAQACRLIDGLPASPDSINLAQ